MPKMGVFLGKIGKKCVARKKLGKTVKSCPKISINSTFQKKHIKSAYEKKGKRIFKGFLRFFWVIFAKNRALYPPIRQRGTL